jgi:tetratricopeptide (TPR) repeat protein
VIGDNTAQNGECLSDEILTDYLEGALSPVARKACEAHLITCDPCRENLALFMRVLREDLTPKEEAALQKLTEICEPRSLHVVPAESSRRPKRLGYAVAGSVVAVILAFSAGYFLQSTRPTSEITQALLAQVRPFEPRISGQPYRVAEEVTRGPDDAKKLGALAAEVGQRAQAYEMGQFFLIQKQYADAIKNLQSAAKDKSAPADVHNDLGVAYLQNGEETFGLAETEFKAALAQDPKHASAVFNLSILYEREGLTGQAETWWRRYLEMDRDSGWAQEIKRKMGREGTAQ